MLLVGGIERGVRRQDVCGVVFRRGMRQGGADVQARHLLGEIVGAHHHRVTRGYAAEAALHIE